MEKKRKEKEKKRRGISSFYTHGQSGSFSNLLTLNLVQKIGGQRTPENSRELLAPALEMQDEWCRYDGL